MAQQHIDVGTVAGDGTGTKLRAAFQKVNANFSEVYRLADVVAEAVDALPAPEEVRQAIADAITAVVATLPTAAEIHAQIDDATADAVAGVPTDASIAKRITDAIAVAVAGIPTAASIQDQITSAINAAVASLDISNFYNKATVDQKLSDLKGSADAAHDTLGELATLVDAASATAAAALPRAGGLLTGALNFAAPVTLASAATVEIGTAASNVVDISGSVTITALGPAPAGAMRWVRFQAALTLTHNASTLILPGGANILVAAGDTAVFRSLGSGAWRCLDYTRGDGTALVAPPAATPVAGSRTLSTNDTIVAADRGRVLNLNGTFTLGATAAATLGAGFYCHLRKTDGNGIVTFDPNGAEMVNGRSTILVYQEAFLLWTDGTAWFTQGRPKGWVAIASVVLTGQSLALLDITAGFTDPEMLEVETVFSNLIASASATHRIAPMKAGAIVATGNSVVELIQTSGTSISAISTTGAPSNTNLTPVATAGPITGKLRAPNTQSTLPADARLEFDAVQSGATRRAWVWDTGTNDSLSGVRFTVSTGTITSITYTVKGYRP